jgi:hypothetical protein
MPEKILVGRIRFPVHEAGPSYNLPRVVAEQGQAAAAVAGSHTRGQPKHRAATRKVW